MTVAENTKRIAKSKKLTQVDMAARMGMSQGAFSLMMKGNITLSSIEKIASALEVEPWELFTTREEIEAERKRRIENLAVPRASVACPCCGRSICIMSAE